MSPRQTARTNWIVWSLTALVAVLLSVYAQLRAFAWDEGWHLLAAQNIDRGKTPYLDFCYPQTPLNVYWNAFWMRLFGDTWHTPHAVAGVLTALAVLLIAVYILRTFPVRQWRLYAAVSAVCLVGLNIMVFEFGTIGQAYALCLLLIVSAYLFTVTGADRAGPWHACAAGFLASAAANCSLLTAPVAPVLLVWIFFCNRAGNRWAKAAAFIAGCVIPCLPLAWLYTRGPKQTIFNVLHYNLLYRQRSWEGAVAHNFGEWFAWVGSPQVWTLGLLAVTGLWFVWKRSGWETAQRRDFYLCAWLAVALIAHISYATPTFRRYYLLAVPFVAILACAGLYDIASRLTAPGRPWIPVLVVCLLTFACLAKRLVEGWNDYSWYTSERISAKVKEVTSPQATLLADELTYFVTRHAAPSALELADSHKLDFPPAIERLYHVMSVKELEAQITAGRFDVIEMSDDDDRIDKLSIRKMYAHCDEVEDTDVFWGKK